MKVLHVISDIATPHNNVLMQALHNSGNCKLYLYYSAKTAAMYSWGEDIFSEVGSPVVLGKKNIHWKFVWYALLHSKENYLFIGWPNNTARLLLILFWIFNRSFLFWSDHPLENHSYTSFISAIRNFLYYIVKTKARRIFLVGHRTVAYFKQRGYDESKLTNLPIYIRINKNKTDFLNVLVETRSKYHIAPEEMLFISGSRLTKEKGFNILINAARNIQNLKYNNFKIVIVGQGEEEAALKRQITELNLADIVTMKSWMTPDDFETLIACSDVYIHPATFDAFGGGTLHAMALGVPVIGSDGAGAVIERVQDGWNGFIFPSHRDDKLSECMIKLINNRNMAIEMGKNARLTAEKWKPEQGAAIIYDSLI